MSTRAPLEPDPGTPTADASAGWPGRIPFAGRDALLQILNEELRAVRASSGRVVFVSGARGCGRTALVRRFERQAARRHLRLRSTYMEAAGADHGSVWRTAPVRLTMEHRVGRSIRRTAVEWLGVVPVVGDLLQAAIETVAAARESSTDPRRQRWEKTAQQLRLQGARALLEMGARDRRLLIVDDLGRGAPADLAGAGFLIDRIAETRTLLVVTYREDPGGPSREINDLIARAERATVTSRLRVNPLTPTELREAVSAATRSSLPASWADWLGASSHGNPTRLWALIGDLARLGFVIQRGRSWEWRLFPRDGAGLPAAPVEDAPLDLAESDRELLTYAAAEGDRFHGVVLADLAGLDELDLEDRLAGLVRSGVLEFEGEATLRDELTSVYRFRDATLPSRLRARHPPEEMRALQQRAGTWHPDAAPDAHLQH